MDTLDCLSTGSVDMTEIEKIAYSENAVELFKETFSHLNGRDFYSKKVEFDVCHARVRFEKKLEKRELKKVWAAITKFQNAKNKLFVKNFFATRGALCKT